jgi:diacylglycerol kinase family enzyme
MNLCAGMNRLDMLKVMYDLGQGKFPHCKGRFSKKVKSLDVDTERPVALETDGEVFMGRNFHFSIIQKSITLLGK